MPNLSEIPVKVSPDIQTTIPSPKHPWYTSLWQIARFSTVGVLNTLIDVITLNTLLWLFPTHNANILLFYNSIAYVVGALNSFGLNKYWTFRHQQRTTRRQVVRFVISLFLEVLYSNGLIWLAGKALQPVITNVTLWGNASKLLAVVGGTVISYAFMRFWTFTNGSQDRPKKQKTIH